MQTPFWKTTDFYLLVKTTHGEETYARQSPDIEHNAGTEATYAK